MDDVRPLHAAATAGEAETGSRGQEESVESLAQKTGYQILEAALTQDQLYQRCLNARALGLGSVIVRPCDVDSTLRFLSLGVVQVASTVGYPYGGAASGVKVYECRDLLRRGVKQIYAYPNPGTLLSRQFQHQEVELIQLADACIEAGASLKIVADSQLLNEEMRIILCRMAKRVNAHFLATTEPRDLELLRKYCGHHVGLECGGVETLEDVRLAFQAGCEKTLTRNPQPVLDALAKELAATGPRP